MDDRVLPGLGAGNVSASDPVLRRNLVDTGFRKWLAGRVYRHCCADWGDLPQSGVEANFAALLLGGPVVSRWPFEDDFLIIVHDSMHENIHAMLESEGRFEISGLEGAA